MQAWVIYARNHTGRHALKLMRLHAGINDATMHLLAFADKLVDLALLDLARALQLHKVFSHRSVVLPGPVRNAERINPTHGFENPVGYMHAGLVSVAGNLLQYAMICLMTSLGGNV